MEEFDDVQDLDEGTDDADLGDEEIIEDEDSDLEIDDESESEEEEQSEEDQDDLEEEEEQEEDPELTFKDEKTGNFDWKKIKSKLGGVGAELEKSFSEAQKTTNKALREKGDLERQLHSLGDLNATREKIQQFDAVDYLYRTNPEVRASVDRALGLQSSSPQQGAGDLPPGVNPEDPLFPIVRETQAALQSLLHQQRVEQQNRQLHERRETFRQGLMKARDRFESLVGRRPTEQEIRAVAEKMRDTNVFNGDEWVPSLFFEEIQKSANRKLYASRKEKRKLPKNPKAGLRSTSTSKRLSREDAFEEAWREHVE